MNHGYEQEIIELLNDHKAGMTQHQIIDMIFPMEEEKKKHEESCVSHSLQKLLKEKAIQRMDDEIYFLAKGPLAEQVSRQSPCSDMEDEKNSDPYQLDEDRDSDGNRIVLLTSKNVQFIEAVIKLDSNYGPDLDPQSAPDSKFREDMEMSNPPNKTYCGSTAYWFEQMKEGKDFKTCLKWAIVAIDRTNSTHLEACEKGRTVVLERILGLCDSVTSLKHELEKSIWDEGKHILFEIAKAMPGKRGKANTKRDDSSRVNISFASKFCSYASIYLRTENKYSKYDRVVADNLPKYAKFYLGKDKKKKEYRIPMDNKKSKEGRFQKRKEIYLKYARTIEEILNKVNENNIEPTISKDDFDKIVWYTMKGKG